MTRHELLQAAAKFIESDPGNIVSGDIAIEPGAVGMKLYDPACICVGRSDDPLFEELKKGSAVGPHFLMPHAWLENTKSVVSLFLPASKAVRKSNASDMEWPSAGWLHARIEGQALINRTGAHLQELLIGQGFDAVVPTLDSRFVAYPGQPPNKALAYTSNWSERHIAFVCGHGTFGLSKGLITKHGVAGRFISILTSAELAYDKRTYTDVYEHCTMCGVCAKNCPAGAISLETGKDHEKCNAFLQKTKAAAAPRYGCGKCQVRVPCEMGAAKR